MSDETKPSNGYESVGRETSEGKLSHNTYAASRIMLIAGLALLVLRAFQTGSAPVELTEVESWLIGLGGGGALVTNAVYNGARAVVKSNKAMLG